MLKISRIFIVLGTLALVTIGCGEDNTENSKPTPDGPNPTSQHNHDLKTAQSWICKHMCDWYLWSDDIPKNTNYEQGYDKFFTSLLSKNRQDGKHNSSEDYFYSYIERKNAGTRASQTARASFGFDFMLTSYIVASDGTWEPSNTVNDYEQVVVVNVTYVVPGSPADQKGIRRGSQIATINGTKLTYDNYQQMYPKLLPESYTSVPLSSATVNCHTFTKSAGTVLLDDNTLQTVYNFTKLGTLALAPASVNDNAVHHFQVLNAGGKKVGYIVYNSFETGEPTWVNHDYDNKMKEAFRTFKAQGVSELVIDLRYNGGGYITDCQLMCSMIVKETQLGKHFLKLQHNPTIAARQTEKYGAEYCWDNFLTVAQMSGKTSGGIYPYGDGAGVNLNLSKVYVIGTGSTASASESVINSLRGCGDGGIKVYLVGSQTEGKTVGMDLINAEEVGGGTYDGYEYSMRPITFYVSNAQGKADFANGFTPDYECYEADKLPLKPFGDPEELMLAAALKHISSGSFPATKSGRSKSLGKASGIEFNSASLKPNRGALRVTSIANERVE